MRQSFVCFDLFSECRQSTLFQIFFLQNWVNCHFYFLRPFFETRSLCLSFNVSAAPVSDFSDCTANQFRCANNHCISNLSKCNGRRDCLDGSDEVECAPVYTDGRYCLSDQFTCHNHVSNSWLEWSCFTLNAYIVVQNKNSFCQHFTSHVEQDYHLVKSVPSLLLIDMFENRLCAVLHGNFCFL